VPERDGCKPVAEGSKCDIITNVKVYENMAYCAKLGLRKQSEEWRKGFDVYISINSLVNDIPSTDEAH
jgi:hypothetical protein